jgi:predicted RNase H-like HicB family nuclease
MSFGRSNRTIFEPTGCVAAGYTLEETQALIREAIEFHIEGMRLNGEGRSEPTRHVEELEVAV